MMKNIVVRNYFCNTGEYRGAAHSISNSKNSTPEEIAVIFHIGSNYDYNFIVEKIVEELKENLISKERIKKNI